MRTIKFPQSFQNNILNTHPSIRRLVQMGFTLWDNYNGYLKEINNIYDFTEEYSKKVPEGWDRKDWVDPLLETQNNVDANLSSCASCLASKIARVDKVLQYTVKKLQNKQNDK